MSTIAERIKIVRKDARLTQQRFADVLGLKQNTIATYEMNRTVPSDRTISDICEKFHIDETWLRTGVGEMKAETTEQEKLSAFFADVLATAPDDRSAFISALADLPPEFWPLVVDLAKSLTANLNKKEGRL